MKYAAIAAMLLGSTASADTPCEAALAYVNLVNEQRLERSNRFGDVRDTLSLGIPMLDEEEAQQWYADVSVSMGRVTLYEIKSSRENIEYIKRLSSACRLTVQ